MAEAALARQEPREKPANPFEGLRQELLGYVQDMKVLRSADPDEAMAWLSSVSARALEMISFTLTNDCRAATKFRIEELIPFRDETRFQFQVASRRWAVQEQEWQMVRGQET